MSYEEAQEILKRSSRGKDVRPWDVLNASITIKNQRELVPCPSCSVYKIMRFQRDEGQSCSACNKRKNA